MGTAPRSDYEPPRPDLGGIPELIALCVVVIAIAAIGDWIGWWVWW
ncbi:hypothetical protein QLQ77_gp01 [Gordonia phage Reyja]|uniref:Uncharacterized protein n=1 Tax=Gordonia phage Reyja TaxID=2571250 RepID=A0A4D6TAG0_9CAUD|nr:hypothetical protein QLQ77_gp01 [Gordonia phage Reyja]QCG77747.1 hypothetical protein SEA_REYJA_1 [Gordonia phage Reyja]